MSEQAPQTVVYVTQREGCIHSGCAFFVGVDIAILLAIGVVVALLIFLAKSG